MENLDAVGFKFRIGDIVYHRMTMLHEYKTGERKRTCLMIIERSAQECHGGVQLMYKCRTGLFGGVSTIDPNHYQNFMEFELEGE